MTSKRPSKKHAKKGSFKPKKTTLTTSKKKNEKCTWTPNEDLVVMLTDTNTKTWTEVAKLLPGRDPHDCRQRFHSLRAGKKGRWSELEAAWLCYAMYITQHVPHHGRWLLVARIVGTRSYRQAVPKWAAMEAKGTAVVLTSKPAEATEDQEAAINKATNLDQAPTMPMLMASDLYTTWTEVTDEVMDEATDEVTDEDVGAFLSDVRFGDDAMLGTTVDASGVVAANVTTDDFSMYDIGIQVPCPMKDFAPAPVATATLVHVASASAAADWFRTDFLPRFHAQQVA
ncbi:hypothetical protein SPRG_08348 [Saprolegnia parasitica CBS 223.65]|uniref:Uncharacterized protein n=1 Tax=Saprolegnia parasitica (strain CBS 223.65) TaxID=695850 RepID=A0A067CHJ3_SAPPC|nr:hypothetical protein SPRG_08348 [Saprolegnia parasitica CBS 223.65]KDO26272.1 hypothetical protein SPRG_08348 [Saprolegnia parasitica CBS 223.65]|eukprot:XP_012202979.1 hypothetical protein SPRG_08348 [Saprolegnia parasitica CBS 223.65]